MTSDSVVELLRHMLVAAFWLAAPMLIVGFVAAIVVSLVQIATSIQDNAFSAVPRLAAFLTSLLLLLPWMIARAETYAASILGNLGRYAR
jgi:flagellar biosynthesis protein FliQ